MHGYRKLHDPLLDQGIQFTKRDWASFLKFYNLELWMSRSGNCHDKAAAENFFILLKRKRIHCKLYKTRADARAEVFN